jgi:enoyl-CoA hydratase/carnithine racemase
MAYDGYECLRIRVERGVAFVTIDHPPINLLDVPMIRDLDRVGRELAADDAVRAVVFASADPEFFIAHADVGLILGLPRESSKPTQLGFFHAMVDRFRTMPKATIAQIEGRARGGGSEFALSCDLRFGAIGRAIVSQPEVALGIIPGGSGTQRLARLMGRARALEAILGCEDFPAELAERYGWLNRALPPDELASFVEQLAFRIASFPAQAIALAKEAVDAAERPTVEGLLEEAHAFNRALADPSSRIRMERFLEIGGQTREGELHVARLVERLSE